MCSHFCHRQDMKLCTYGTLPKSSYETGAVRNSPSLNTARDPGDTT